VSQLMQLSATNSIMSLTRWLLPSKSNGDKRC